MKTLDEFKHAGGVVGGGKSHTHEEYDGAPRPYNEKLSTTIEKILPGHQGSHTGTNSGFAGSNTTGHHTGTDPGFNGHHNDSSNLGTRNRRRGSDSSSSSSDDGHGKTGRTGKTSKAGKPSLGDKLNPRVDANGDGQAGFMK